MSDSQRPETPSELQQALLRYATTPGKYSVKLRQPAILFAGMADVLQLAAQRQVPADSEAASLVSAARFFVQTALLHPEADHHTVLGVEDGAPPQVVKERYRLLMRLLHPDFAAGQDWPADAAARVNRAYDYVSSGGAAAKPIQAPTSVVPSDRPARVASTRPATAAAVAWNLPKSRLKHAFILLGFIGLCLMLLVLTMDRQSPVHLVQKPPVPKVRGDVEPASPSQASLGTAIGSTLSDLLADISRSSSLQMSTELNTTPAPRNKPAPVAAAPTSPAPASPSPARQAPARTSAPRVDDAPVIALAPRQELPPDMPPPQAPAAPVAISEPVRNVASVVPARPEQPPAPVMVAAAPVVSAPAPRPGLTLVEAQPLLAVLLQHMETGRGERILSLLEPDARSRPAAQAFSKQYDSVVDGARVRLSQVQFRAEPSDGKLVVMGQMRMQFPDLPIGVLPRRFALQAEFVNRNGTVVLTGLSGGPLN